MLSWWGVALIIMASHVDCCCPCCFLLVLFMVLLWHFLLLCFPLCLLVQWRYCSYLLLLDCLLVCILGVMVLVFFRYTTLSLSITLSHAFLPLKHLFPLPWHLHHKLPTANVERPPSNDSIGAMGTLIIDNHVTSQQNHWCFCFVFVWFSCRCRLARVNRKARTAITTMSRE